MKMIIQFMKDYKKESVLAPLFKMLEAMLELLVPLVVASIIDQGDLPGEQTLHFYDVSGAVRSGSGGPAFFHYGPVFCGQVGGGRGDGHAFPAVCAHPVVWIQGRWMTSAVPR